MQSMSMLKRVLAELHGPENTGPCSCWLLAVAFIVMAGISSPSLAGDEQSVDWATWQDSVIHVWDEWQSQYFSGEKIAFEVVVSAYADAMAEIEDLALADTESAGFQAQLSVLNSMSFYSVALPESELAGYSVQQSYERALAIWTALERRGDQTRLDAERFIEMALSVRDFDTAIRINKSEALELNLPAGAQPHIPGAALPRQAVWVFDDQGRLELREFVFPEAMHWVVVATEGCGFCQLFLSDVVNNEILAELVGDRLTWLVPANPFLDTALIEQAVGRSSTIRPRLMHSASEWPMFTEMYRSPMIYQMRGDEVIARWVGWPRDRSHIPEMLASWQEHAEEAE